jgi:hypothetical protein
MIRGAAKLFKIVNLSSGENSDGGAKKIGNTDIPASGDLSLTGEKPGLIKKAWTLITNVFGKQATMIFF